MFRHAPIPREVSGNNNNNNQERCYIAFFMGTCPGFFHISHHYCRLIYDPNNFIIVH